MTTSLHNLTAVLALAVALPATALDYTSQFDNYYVPYDGYKKSTFCKFQSRLDNTADLLQIYPDGFSVDRSKDYWMPQTLNENVVSEDATSEVSSQLEYSAEGLVVKETTADQVRTFEYNERGQVVKVLTTSNGSTSMMTYEYDQDYPDWCVTRKEYYNANDTEPYEIYFHPIIGYDNGTVAGIAFIQYAMDQSEYEYKQDCLKYATTWDQLNEIFDSADTYIKMGYDEDGKVSQIIAKSGAFHYYYELSNIVWKEYEGQFMPAVFSGINGATYCQPGHRIKSCNAYLQYQAPSEYTPAFDFINYMKLNAEYDCETGEEYILKGVFTKNSIGKTDWDKIGEQAYEETMKVEKNESGETTTEKHIKLNMSYGYKKPWFDQYEYAPAIKEGFLVKDLTVTEKDGSVETSYRTYLRGNYDSAAWDYDLSSNYDITSSAEDQVEKIGYDYKLTGLNYRFDDLIEDSGNGTFEYADFKKFAAGIEDVVAESSNAPAEYYTISGVRVGGENLAPGIYIKRQGGRAEKFLVK